MYKSDFQGDLIVEHNMHVMNDQIVDGKLTTANFESTNLAQFDAGISLDSTGSNQLIQNFFSIHTLNAVPLQVLNFPQTVNQSSFCDFMIIASRAGLGSASFSGEFKSTNIAGVSSLSLISPYNSAIDPSLVGANITIQAVGNAFVINVVGLAATDIAWSVSYKVLSAT